MVSAALPPPDTPFSLCLSLPAFLERKLCKPFQVSLWEATPWRHPGNRVYQPLAWLGKPPHPRAPSQRQAGGVEGWVLLWLVKPQPWKDHPLPTRPGDLWEE